MGLLLRASCPRSTAPSSPGEPSPLPELRRAVRRLRPLAAASGCRGRGSPASSPSGASRLGGAPPSWSCRPTTRGAPWRRPAATRRPVRRSRPQAARRQGPGRRRRATLFMTLLAIFDVLLFRYTGQEDFVVGVPVAEPQPAPSSRGRSAASPAPCSCAPRLSPDVELPRAPRPGARRGARRLRPLGPAVREARRGAAAGAQPVAQPALPGDVRAPERGRRRRARRAPALSLGRSCPSSGGSPSST